MVTTAENMGKRNISLGCGVVLGLFALIPDEKKLGRYHNTLEKLLAHPKIGKFVQWKREHARSDE